MFCAGGGQVTQPKLSPECSVGATQNALGDCYLPCFSSLSPSANKSSANFSLVRQVVLSIVDTYTCLPAFSAKSLGFGVLPVELCLLKLPVPRPHTCYRWSLTRGRNSQHDRSSFAVSYFHLLDLTPSRTCHHRSSTGVLAWMAVPLPYQWHQVRPYSFMFTMP